MRIEYMGEGLFELQGHVASACTTESSFELAARLRHEAYVASGDLEPTPSGQVRDSYDGSSNHRTHLISKGERPVGSVRSGIWSPERGLPTEAAQLFAEEIRDAIGGRPVLESNRFVIAPGLPRRASMFVQLLLFRVQDLSVFWRGR